MNRRRAHEPAPPRVPDLGGLADLVLPVVIGFAAAALVGLLVAVVLRRRGLAWTWGFLSLSAPGALLAALLGGAAALSVASAAALATSIGFAVGLVGWSVHQRLEDRRAGGDREAAAAAHRRPLDPLRRRLAERGADGPEAGVPLGRSARGELGRVPRGTASSGCHVLVPGASGAGKTTSLAALLVEYVVRSGFGAVVLEAKCDTALRDVARAAAAARGVPFRFISPEGPSGYDPLARGSVDERSERLIAAQEWGSGDAEFYRQAASPFLRLALRVLAASGRTATLRALAESCDPDELVNAAMKLEDADLDAEVNASAAALRADERRAIAGMRARLHNLASSQFASRWLDPTLVPDAIDLRAAIERREVVYLRLDTDRTGNVGRAIAQMALLDLGAAASAMMDRGVGTFVAIDEFGALEASALDRLFTRGRAAGFSVALGTQTLADLCAAGPAVRERIGATASAIVCHRLGSQEDAEWVAQLIGTVPTWESTVRTDRFGLPSEQGTRTRGHRFEVNPAELQRLARGEACLGRLDGTEGPRVLRVGVVPAWERLPAVRDQSPTEPRAARREK